MTTETMPGLTILGSGAFPAPGVLQPTPMLTLPHQIKVSNVAPTDAPPDVEIWTTAIIRAWAKGTAKHCTLCPAGTCRIYDAGLMDICSVGIDGYIELEELQGIGSHQELFAGGGVPGPGGTLDPAAGGTTGAARLRVVHGRFPDDA